VTASSPGPFAPENPQLVAQSVDGGASSVSPEASEPKADAATVGDAYLDDARSATNPAFRAGTVAIHRVPTAGLETWRAMVTDVAMRDVAELERFPQDASPPSHARIEWVSSAARELVIDGESSIVAPLRLLFRDTPTSDTRSYCFLAVIRAARARAELLPMGEGLDTCKGIDLVAETDLNKDGLPDFVFDVRIPSNRYAAIVVESEAYLSGPDAAYCLSTGVSDVVPRHGPLSSAVLRAAVDAEIARVGPSVLDCRKPR
jgi:hypothetical protein